jgi:hypothetical protein
MNVSETVPLYAWLRIVLPLKTTNRSLTCSCVYKPRGHYRLLPKLPNSEDGMVKDICNLHSDGWEELADAAEDHEHAHGEIDDSARHMLVTEQHQSSEDDHGRKQQRHRQLKHSCPGQLSASTCTVYGMSAFASARCASSCAIQG